MSLTNTDPVKVARFPQFAHPTVVTGVLDQFTRWQSMNWDYAGTLQKAQMDVEKTSADMGFQLG